MDAAEAFAIAVSVGATLAVFAALQFRRVSADVVFLSALVGVTVCGVIPAKVALAGFANSAVITVAGLLVVSAGLRWSGVLDWLGRAMLGTARTPRQALWRLAPSLVASSAFMLNTAVVAMGMPVVLDWCRRHHVSPSRLLMPLSYLAILGGVCTLIGTSTTLVVNGELRERSSQPTAQRAEGEPGQASPESAADHPLRPLGLFELGKAGLPIALIGTAYMVLVAPWLLPRRVDILEQLGEQRREYLIEMLVQPECPLIGKSVELAGLRHLPGLFLIEIDRGGDILTPVSPDDVIRGGDRLVFTGVVSTIVDLEKIPGLVPAADITYEFSPLNRSQRRLSEVVLSRTSPLIGTTVKRANFRQLYNAAVVAVHRNGVRLTNKIGNIRLEPGDTLLLQTRDDFVAAYRNNRDFYLVSAVEGDEPRHHHKARVASGLVVALLAWLIAASWWSGQGHSLAGWLGQGEWLGRVDAGLGSTAIAAICIAVLMVATGCLRASDARNAIDLQILITIAAALGLGRALEASGAAELGAGFLVAQVGDRPWLLLIVLYLLAALLTETISNNAVAAILLPLAVETAAAAGHNPRPFVIAITLAASLSFLTPIGYQTNLMVMGPGGYRPVDYLRVGLPLSLIVAATALFLIPRIWPF